MINKKITEVTTRIYYTCSKIVYGTMIEWKWNNQYYSANLQNFHKPFLLIDRF